MIAERLRLLVLSAALCTGAAHAATITIINTDAANTGFNDPSPATPVDGNPGTTLGAQRLYVLQTAADRWGQLLKSNVEIKVSVLMKTLNGCGTNSVTLGGARPQGVVENFANAPRANRTYPFALANALAGTDLDSSTTDIYAEFNIGLDTGTCLQGTVGWWYGVNDPALVPANRIPLLPVVFHEIGHGLGFTSGVGFSLFGPSVPTDTPIWFDFVYDQEQGKHWSELTSSNVITSLTNDPNVVWTGTNVNRYQNSFLGPPLIVRVNAPAGIAGDYAPVQNAAFGPPLGAGGLTGGAVLINDGVAASGGGTNTDGCETPFTNASAVAGKIALIDRGVCTFATKTRNAQAAGAIGVIIANNAATGLPPMGDDGGTPPTIPSVGVTQALGTTLRNNLTGLNLTLGLGTGRSGVNGGCVRIYSPDPAQPGSSGSHFHSEANPNLLMEPALNRSIFKSVDLTIELFRDIGWQTERDDVLFADWFDKNPCPVGPMP